MILPDYEIHELCSKHAMVVPFDPELVNPASIDVLLGDRLMVEWEHSSSMQIMGISHCTKENPYWLAPGEFVVALPSWFWGTLIALVFTLLASGITIVVGIDRPQIDMSDRQQAIWRLLDRLRWSADSASS